MARPKKKGSDYFPFDVGFFRDLKIRSVMVYYGTSGVLLYIYLLTVIYEQGYYIKYDNDLLCIASDDLKMKPEKVGQIINFFCKRSLFNDKLFTTDKVLTSDGIQLRYQEMVRSRAIKNEIAVDKRFWILSKEETEPFIKVYPDENYSENNEGFSKKNGSNSENNATKERKVKEKKEKERKEEEKKAAKPPATSPQSAFCQLPAANGEYVLTTEFYNSLVEAYPHTNIDECIRSIKIWLAINPGKRKPSSAMDRFVNNWIKDDAEKGKHIKHESDAAYDLEAYESLGIFDEEVK